MALLHPILITFLRTLRCSLMKTVLLNEAFHYISFFLEGMRWGEWRVGLGLHLQCRAIINKHFSKAISFPFYWNVEDRETKPCSSGGIFSSVNAMELIAMMFLQCCPMSKLSTEMLWEASNSLVSKAFRCSFEGRRFSCLRTRFAWWASTQNKDLKLFVGWDREPKDVYQRARGTD